MESNGRWRRTHARTQLVDRYARKHADVMSCEQRKNDVFVLLQLQKSLCGLFAIGNKKITLWKTQDAYQTHRCDHELFSVILKENEAISIYSVGSICGIVPPFFFKANHPLVYDRAFHHPKRKEKKPGHEKAEKGSASPTMYYASAPLMCAGPHPSLRVYWDVCCQRHMPACVIRGAHARKTRVLSVPQVQKHGETGPRNNRTLARSFTATFTVYTPRCWRHARYRLVPPHTSNFEAYHSFNTYITIRRSTERLEMRNRRSPEGPTGSRRPATPLQPTPLPLFAKEKRQEPNPTSSRGRAAGRILLKIARLERPCSLRFALLR